MAQRTKIRVLGVDVGRTTGYAVLEGDGRSVTVVSTRADADQTPNEFDWQIRSVAVELPIVSTTSTTFREMAPLRRLWETRMAEDERYVEVKPGSWKSILKTTRQYMTLLESLGPISTHERDAVGIALYQLRKLL